MAIFSDTGIKCVIFGPKDKMDSFLFSQTTIINNKIFRDYKYFLKRHYSTVSVNNIKGDRIDYLQLVYNSLVWDNTNSFKSMWERLMEDALDWELNYEIITVSSQDDNNINIKRAKSHKGPNLLTVERPVIVDTLYKTEDTSF